MERLEPNLGFLRSLRRQGGESLKKCFQCGTCSAVCNLTPNASPFPRKEMLWAQWGLKGPLIADPDIWLCHGCGDCSANCPRGANPSEVLGALRNQTIEEYSGPRSFAKAFRDGRFLLLLLAIPILFMVVAFAWRGGLAFPTGTVEYANFIPEQTIELTLGSWLLLTLIVAVAGLSRFWKGMLAFEERYRPAGGAGTASGGGWAGWKWVLGQVFGHQQFGKCQRTASRRWQHLLIFYGFLLLFFATLGRTYYHYIWHYDYELPLFNVVKLAGNLGGIILLVGLGAVIYTRFLRGVGQAISVYFDWFFVTILGFTALTGFLTELSRLEFPGPDSYLIYLSHLFFIFLLLVYLPFSKFGHILYRTLALYHLHRTGRVGVPIASEPTSSVAELPSKEIAAG